MGFIPGTFPQPVALREVTLVRRIGQPQYTYTFEADHLTERPEVIGSRYVMKIKPITLILNPHCGKKPTFPKSILSKPPSVKNGNSSSRFD